VIAGDSMLSPEHLAGSMYHSLFGELRDLLTKEELPEQLAVGIGRIQLRLPGISEPVAIEELPGNSPATLAEWARSARCTDPDVLTMAIEGTTYAGWSAQAILERITCPLLLLQANPELDGLLRDADVALARHILPGVEHIKFPLLGHGLFMQRPEPVLKAIYGFLGRHVVEQR
jgi:pimeloyl-ACP methyl ester carboxylesterase